MKRIYRLLAILPIPLLFTMLAIAATPRQNIQQSEVLMESDAQAQAAINYWTPERMKHAKPYPLRASFDKPQLSAPARISGMAGFGESGMPKTNRGAMPDYVIPYLSDATQSVGYNYPGPFARYQNFESYNVFPYTAIVKVFATDGRFDFTCSGSVWPNHAVLTAGHCVYDNIRHAYLKNVMVIPEYKNGSGPFGEFAATKLVTTQGWRQGDGSFDMGLILTEEQNGSSISSLTGFLGAKWNVTPVQHFTIIGYPATKPFNGQTQQICQASYAYSDKGDPQPVGLGCDLTDGSSGCPWIIKFGGKSGQTNFVNGLMSYGYDSRPLDSYSPYFGNAAMQLWNYAKTH